MLSCIVACALALGALPGESQFLSAHDALRTGDYAKALAEFQTCAGQYPDFAPFAQVYAARAEAGLGRFDAALARYGSLLEAEPRGAWTDMAFADMARMQRERKAYEKAAALYHHVLNVSPRPWWMNTYPWEAAECLLAIPGRESDAYAYYREVILTTGLIQPRLDASRLLLASKESDDRALALLGMLRSAAYRDANKALVTAGIELDKPGGGTLAVAELTALSSGQGDSATVPLADWPAFATANSDNPWLPVWLLLTVRQAAENGRFDKALAAADLLVERYAKTRDPADALWWLANYLDGRKRDAEAERLYLRIADDCPSNFRADDALMRVAERRANRGDREVAVKHFTALAKRFPDSRFVAQAYTRCAELASKAGDVPAAKQYLALAADSNMGDFYAYRACARLADMGERRAAERDIAVAPGRTLLRVRPVTANHPRGLDNARVERLRFFGRHGIDAGEFETVVVCQEMADSPELAAWRQALAEAGYAHTAWQFARADADAAKKPDTASYRLDYPLAYWPEVEAMAREYALDPFLLLAVSRQESTFRADIESHAGAKGVMQLMPRTAGWIATKEDTVTASHAGHLGSPVNSLRLGACYLRMMLDRSDDNLVYALASYNGGPGNCDKWRRRYGGSDMDRFIEAITFDETRNYVKKVLGNLAAYHTLYPDVADSAPVAYARPADVPAS